MQMPEEFIRIGINICTGAIPIEAFDVAHHIVSQNLSHPGTCAAR